MIESGPMTPDAIRRYASYDAPLEGIEETDSEWLLGSMHVGKFDAKGGTSWRGPFDESTQFRKEWFDAPDHGRRGWAIIFRHTAHSPEDQRPIEYFAGWVPPEGETEADEWISFLNSEIRNRLAEGAAEPRLRRDSALEEPASTPPSTERKLSRAEELVQEQRRYQLSNPHVSEEEPLFTETIGDGQYYVDEHLWGVRRWRVYMGHSVANPEEHVLISMDDGFPKVGTEQLRQDLGYTVPGMLDLAYVGAFDAAIDPARQKDIRDWGMLVEHLPSGGSARRLITAGLGATEATRLGCSVGAIVERATRAGILVVALRPEYIWVEADATGQLVVRGLTDRYYKFFKSRSYGEFNTLLPFPRSYGAPEAETKPSERSLVFMLAALVAEWTTGRYPFPGLWQSVAGGMLIGVRTSEAPDLAGLPPDLEALLLRGLSPDPEQRPALSTFLHALEQFAR